MQASHSDAAPSDESTYHPWQAGQATNYITAQPRRPRPKTAAFSFN